MANYKYFYNLLFLMMVTKIFPIIFEFKKKLKNKSDTKTFMSPSILLS